MIQTHQELCQFLQKMILEEKGIKLTQEANRQKIIFHNHEKPDITLDLEVIAKETEPNENVGLEGKIVLVFAVTLGEKWDQLIFTGLHHINKLILNWNKKKEVIENYELNIHERSIKSKKIIPIPSILKDNPTIISQSFHELKDKIKLIFNKISGIEEGSQKQLYDKFDQHRIFVEKTRQQRFKSTKVELLNLKENETSFEKIQKFSVKEAEKLVRVYKEKTSQEPQILRCFKKLEVKKDEKWKEGPQNWSAISKCLIKYEICDYVSIHNASNKIILEKKFLSPTTSEDSKSDKKQYVEAMVEKKKSKKDEASFRAEKNMLAYMRMLSCPSLNKFYCSQVSYIEEIQQIYSQFHPKHLNQFPSRSNVFLKVLCTLTEALVFLRVNGISHRDMKPGNIMLDKSFCVKMIDFGSSVHNKYAHKTEFRVISHQLFTSACYNLHYDQLFPEVKAIFTISEYEIHPHFDIYAYGVLLKSFLRMAGLQEEVGARLWQCLEYISGICTSMNPDDRPDPKDIYVFISYLVKAFKI